MRSLGKTFATTCGALALLAVTPATAFAAAGSQQAGLQAIVDSGEPAAIASIRTNDHEWNGAAGTADLATLQSADSNDAYRIGSVTKPMVATVVLQLVAEGSLSLDDSLESVLPGLVPTGEQITVRNLLDQTSGLPDYDTKLIASVEDLEKYRNYRFSDRDLVALALTGEPSANAPGTYAYANTNYIILGMIIEKITAHPVSEELRHRIFLPAGMNHTILRNEDPNISGPHLNGYFTDPASNDVLDVTQYSPTYVGAAGGVISTTSDVARFFNALLSGKLLEPSLVEDMIAVDPASRYGMGIARVSLSCGDVIGHDGSVFGYANLALSTVDGRKQVVVAMNDSAIATTEAAIGTTVAFADEAFCGVAPQASVK